LSLHDALPIFQRQGWRQKWLNDPDLPRGWKIDGTENCRSKVTSMETEGYSPHGRQCSWCRNRYVTTPLINFPKVWWPGVHHPISICRHFRLLCSMRVLSCV